MEPEIQQFLLLSPARSLSIAMLPAGTSSKGPLGPPSSPTRASACLPVHHVFPPFCIPQLSTFPPSEVLHQRKGRKASSVRVIISLYFGWVLDQPLLLVTVWLVK
jgi:hypothetical protein